MQDYTHAINELVRCEARLKLRLASKHLKGAIKVAKERCMRKPYKEIEKGALLDPGMWSRV